jgi:hypothetical protein
MSKPLPLDPNTADLTDFIKAIFKHASPGAYVAVRVFEEGDSDNVLEDIPAKIVDSSLTHLINVAVDYARRAAPMPKRAVFCPPVATFDKPRRAREVDLAEGVALSVDCDQNPNAARERLEKILGPATVVVKSGGEWQDPDRTKSGGEVQDKLHLHWRLSKPAKGKDELAKLKTARAIACDLVGADPTTKTIVHPLRWPGSWHRKGEPVLCSIDTIDPDIEIGLSTALEKLTPFAKKPTNNTTGNGHDRDPANDWLPLVSDILSAERYHPATTPLTMKLIAAGMQPGAAVNIVRSLMECTAGPQDERWHSRYNEIRAGNLGAEEDQRDRRDSERLNPDQR